jgi:hypothetical protein
VGGGGDDDKRRIENLTFYIITRYKLHVHMVYVMVILSFDPKDINTLVKRNGF